MGLLGTALGAVGSIFGNFKASQAMRNVKDNLQAQQQQNQNWYDRRYNEDSTQRADAQRILQMTEDSIRNRNRQAAGAQAVMGGTAESVAAEKAANARALADATAQIAANGDRRKDMIEGQYMQREAQLNNQLNELEKQKAQNIASTVQGISGAAGGMDFGDINLKNGKTLSL